MNRLVITGSACVLALAPLAAGDLPPALQAKFVRLLANAMGSPGKVACKDGALAAELAKLEVASDPGARMAWAGSEADVRAFKAAGRVVVCGKPEWLPSGAVVAVAEEGGKPVIFLHMGNAAAAGVTIPDAILKIARKV